MITPGPVVITVGFIGYLVAGPAGAVVAALGTFLPCYLFTVIPAPHFRRWSQNGDIRAFVDGVTAAATGAIAGAAFVLGRRAIVDAGNARDRRGRTARRVAIPKCSGAADDRRRRNRGRAAEGDRVMGGAGKKRVRG